MKMKRKNKALKTFGFTSLAMLMGIAGTMVFAPLANTNAKEQPTTTTGLGLDPKNDPVVYTTESGLEIKMSNANKFSSTVTMTTNTGYSYTQDLTSFYYFTMGSFSGTIYKGNSTSATYSVANEPVNWIILGVGSHSTSFVDSVSNYLFSALKNNPYLFSYSENYFNNYHESISPAGQLINNTVSMKTYIMDKVKNSIKVTTEIPKGCMLVMSEKLLGQSYFNSSGSLYDLNTAYPECYLLLGKNPYGNRYRYKGDAAVDGTAQTPGWNNKTAGTLYTYINNLFSKDTSGNILKNTLNIPSEQANLVVPQQLYTFYSNGTSYPYAETPSTDGGTYYTMFPLALNTDFTNNAYQNFCINDYLLNAAQQNASLIGSNNCYPWWTRTGARQYAQHAYSMTPYVSNPWDNGERGGYHTRFYFGVRPAMVMKLQ